MASATALQFPTCSAGPRLSLPRATSHCYLPKHFRSCALPSTSSSASSSVARPTVRASSDGPHLGAYEESMETSSEPASQIAVFPANMVSQEQKALLAVLISLGFALGSAEAARALGPEGPLVEEFWDNMRRYALYFLTVFTGGLYSLLQPILSLLRNPITAVLTVAFLSGSLYLLYLVLNTMLGITNFNYDYA